MCTYIHAYVYVDMYIDTRMYKYKIIEVNSYMLIHMYVHT